MKKRNIFILTGIALFIIGLFVVVGCAKNSSDKNRQGFVLDTDQELVSFSALATANILSNDSKQLLSGTNSATERMLLNGTNIVEPDMEKVNSYMAMMETLFSDGGPVLVKEEVSDRPEYSVKQTFRATNIDGSHTSYVLYLNETLSNKEHDEVEYSIIGLAIVDGVEYSIKGEKEIEEGEVELEIKIELDKGNYIIIEQEQEHNEQEYEYTIVKNGKVFSKLTFEAEEHEETELKITTNENGYRETYKFVEVDNKIKIEHTANNVKYTIFVTSHVNEAGEVIYEYKVKETSKTYNYKK